ncbi:trypsin-like peptidase domain-containing protein [Paraburkholderia sp. SIMBA_053]|uniref:trypsin-like peptidase domain-containing protein n=1 Tax=Paraburkholderia sp. SIMBA_053 TaxID=3085794 RepID=UPI0039794F2F
MSILDDFPFPFDKPEGQELMRVLANLYRTDTEAFLLTQPFGVDPLNVPSGLSARNLWYLLLQMLAAQGTVRATVQAARDRTPNNPRAPFLEALLKDKLAPVSAEPVPAPGANAQFDDSVTEPEALLFFDDLTMPVGQVPNLLATLGGLLERASAVCLLRVENGFGRFFGTGFRIGPKLILTNHHVLFPKSMLATRVQADFGFDVDATGASLPVTSLAGISNSIRGEKPDDWAVVEVDDLDPRWATLPLAAEPVPKVGEAAYILQHPGGQQKRLGFVRNTISDVADGVVRYLTDTEPGSSGAPVFDAQCRLIALHHAGGTPMEVAGKPPVSKNEGIRISRVLARLQAAGILV